MKPIYFNLLFFCFFQFSFGQSNSKFIDSDSLNTTYETISIYDLEYRTDSILDSNKAYYSESEINNFIGLVKEDLPDLSDATIALKLDKIHTTLNIRFTPEIGNQIRNYLFHQRSFIVKMLTKSEYFFPMFESEFDKRNMPLELKYVAVIESHLDPLARSPMGATGLWQFMYATAKYKGMEITTYEDPRKDPLTSSQYAADYFLQLYNIYDDWLLAISAYNAGAGNINKAIRSASDVKNYWVARPFMPRETQKYVPRIIAIMYAMYYAEDYFLYPKRPDFSYEEIQQVKIFDQISFKYASELLGMEEDLLSLLNPVLSKNIIPKRDLGYVINIPHERNLQFFENEGLFNNDPYLAEQHVELEQKHVDDFKSSGSGKYFNYTIQSGDNLGYIAQKFSCTVSQIKRWNGMNSNFLRVGKKVKIYGSKTIVELPKLVQSTNSNVTENIGFKKDEVSLNTCSCAIHEIISGDNLWDISRKYDTTIEKINEINNIPKNWRLKLGVFLKIPK